ncbi:hypothetical protein [Streptomyces sp. NPDC093261]|uniref:hypothetical protein n=1 Tax=Streptomyces sp. NPDC093261 TaxID=3366037 RepID=UPI0038112400
MRWPNCGVRVWDEVAAEDRVDARTRLKHVHQDEENGEERRGEEGLNDETPGRPGVSSCARLPLAAGEDEWPYPATARLPGTARNARRPAPGQFVHRYLARQVPCAAQVTTTVRSF